MEGGVPAREEAVDLCLPCGIATVAAESHWRPDSLQISKPIDLCQRLRLKGSTINPAWEKATEPVRQALPQQAGFLELATLYRVALECGSQSMLF